MNPIIFLDFDGVMNSQLYYEKLKGNAALPTHQDIDPDAIQHLNALCLATNAAVVITATARFDHTLDELTTIFETKGFTGEIIGRTDDLRRGPAADCILRGNEILHWIKSHPAQIGVPYWDYNKYVIIDDDSDFLFWQRNNIVITDPYCGMTRKTVYMAKRILGLTIAINELAG